MSLIVAALLEEAEIGRLIAIEAKNSSAVIAAVNLKAKLLGAIREPGDDRAPAFDQQQAEVRSAADLIGDAFESYGLPRNSPPDQLVGAIASKQYATPAAFRILHAKAQGND
jgi:hypothetical protein